jgi:CubicO group peptidase (beta-lactamase class C family)
MRAALAVCALLLGGAAMADVDARLAEARQAIESHLRDLRQPGIVIGITDRQRLREVVVHGYADLKARTPLTIDSRFAIGSISKAFTSIALMEIADEGRFDPHAPVARYLPELQIKSDFGPMTGHDVMSHTAGLPYYLPDMASSRAVLLGLRDFVPTYAPGAHWHYSDTGYQLMGYVLEQLDNGRYDEILRRRVLVPLGMKDTTAIIDDAQRAQLTVSYSRWPYDGKYVEVPWFEYLAGDGSIVSTVTDMGAYARFYLNRGQVGKQRLLSAKSFAVLTTPVLDNYAYGLHVHSAPGGSIISHDGGIAGFESHIEAQPDRGFALIFLSNGGMDKSLQAWVAQLAAAAFANQPLPPAPAPDPDPLMAPLEDYVGRFQSANSQTEVLGVRLTNGELILKQGTDERHLQRMGVNMFRADEASGDRDAYVFTRADDKPLETVTGVSHGSSWYTRGASHGPKISTQAHYAEYVGHYVNNGPEGPEARIYVREGRLLAALEMDETFAPTPLEPIDDATFRLGPEDWSPERARFDGIIDGHSQRLLIDGVPLYRRETP